MKIILKILYWKSNIEPVKSYSDPQRFSKPSPKTIVRIEFEFYTPSNLGTEIKIPISDI